MVKAGYTDNSNDGFAEDLQAMFSGTQKLSLQPTRAAYVIKYGIYPYLKETLTSELASSKYVLISFDESLNKVTQSNQMDIAVRYVRDGKSHVRYLTSQFPGHSAAVDLEREIKSSLAGILDHNRLTMISMGGPNVNLKLLKMLQAERAEGGQPELIFIGVCNQHVIHNSFKAGAEKSG